MTTCLLDTVSIVIWQSVRLRNLRAGLSGFCKNSFVSSSGIAIALSHMIGTRQEDSHRSCYGQACIAAFTGIDVVLCFCYLVANSKKLTVRLATFLARL